MARRIQCPVWDAGTVPVFCMMAVPLFLPMLSQVALPLPKPNAPLEKGKDQYKIQLSFDGEFPSGHTIGWVPSSCVGCGLFSPSSSSSHTLSGDRSLTPKIPSSLCSCALG